jgi:hypothetical protein
MELDDEIDETVTGKTSSSPSTTHQKLYVSESDILVGDIVRGSIAERGEIGERVAVWQFKSNQQ